MGVVENSKDILRIKSSPKFAIGTTTTFDRAKRTVVVVWFALLLPFRRTVVQMEDILSAQVRKRERQNGRVAYGLTLRRKRDDDINLPCRSRDDAMEIRRTIAEFLSLD